MLSWVLLNLKVSLLATVLAPPERFECGGMQTEPPLAGVFLFFIIN